MQDITAALLEWYDAHARVLPWRGIGDPYAIWVSEIMLQQTRVDTVLRYFPRFMALFPTAEALAAAPEEEVLKAWEGLGYYSRARSLQASARQVSAMGGLPRTAQGLREIKGIGPYTAGAIASIAFGERVSAVDGNVIRVMARLKGIRESMALPPARQAVEEAALALVPAERPGDFNQALMDLGATVCVPGTPDCAVCPLRAFCAAAEAGDAEDLPVMPGRREPKVLRWDVCLMLCGGGVLMRRREERMLNGLWVFPMCEGWREEDGLLRAAQKTTGLHAEKPVLKTECRHVFTHQIWQMRVWTLQATGGEPLPPWQAVTASEMRALPLPAAMRVPAQTAAELIG